MQIVVLGDVEQAISEQLGWKTSVGANGSTLSYVTMNSELLMTFSMLLAVK